MAAAGALAEPLLKVDDVEEGKPQPSAEELEDLRKEGQMNWKQLIGFFLDPTHMLTTALVVYAVACVIGMGYLMLAKKNFGDGDNLWNFCFLAVGGLVVAAYISFLAEQLKEEVNEFWRNNEKLKSNKVRLESTCKELRKSVGTMRDEVDDFNKLKGKMQKFAEEQGEGFSEVFGRAAGVLDKMRESLVDQQRNLLNNYANSFEFSDGEEGMTKEEFSLFKTYLPNEFQEKVSFEEVAGPDCSTVSSDQVQELIKRALESVKAGAAALPLSSAASSSGAQ
uniref:Uncharacterized protein n=1 Tax=Alexandrium andersonii TaxID=327968 RepID=A0A7S2NAC4_9DINO